MTFACVDIKSLVQPQSHRFRKTPDVARFSPIHGNLDGRAREALKYLVSVRESFKKISFKTARFEYSQALRSNAIHRRLQASSAPSEEQEETTENKISRSKLIIPLPYQNNRNCTKFLIDSKNHLTGDRRLKAIILHKAALAYYCLVNRCEQERNYGLSLRYLRLALHCYSKFISCGLSTVVHVGHSRCGIETSIDGSE